MAQLGSVSGIAVKAFTVSGKKNECNMASARSNCFCASGEHEVLKCTRPSFSGSPARLAGSASAHTDATRVRDATSAVRKLTKWLMSSSLCWGTWLGLRRCGGWHFSATGSARVILSTWAKRLAEFLRWPLALDRLRESSGEGLDGSRGPDFGYGGYWLPKFLPGLQAADGLGTLV